jgi:hypothetical protein
MTGTVMNRIQQIRHRAGPARRTDPAFAAWLEQAPAAAARQVVGSVYKVPVHTVVIGGLPGWRNALLAAARPLDSPLSSDPARQTRHLSGRTREVRGLTPAHGRFPSGHTSSHSNSQEG